jgi:hypothetical protein
MAEDTLVAPTPVPGLRPYSLCGANASTLARCALAWESMVLKGAAPRSMEDTWDAAEFEGIIDGFYTGEMAVQGTVTWGTYRWCPKILESYDQLYSITAHDLARNAAQLTINYNVAEYLSKMSERLWPCR